MEKTCLCRWVLLVVCMGGDALVAAEPVWLEESQVSNLDIEVRDKGTGQIMPCRVHLADEKGAPVLLRFLPSFRDHFCCEGTVSLRVSPGTYTYTVERGPEYERATGTVVVNDEGATALREGIGRIADLAQEGWWSGELHVHRPLEHMKLLMRAEDLHVAPVLTWWRSANPWWGKPLPEDPVVRFDEDRIYEVLGGEDERNGGAFLYYRVDQPVDITWAEGEYPSPLHFLEQTKWQERLWIDIEKPFWWDVPVALAHGFGDSIGILNNHTHRSGMLDNEAWGRARPAERYPSPVGNGLWCQDIYYHILNSGIRIPPSAGSASGVLPNPVGYNRLYVYLGPEKLTYDNWWRGLKAGRCFVTNGPLLRADVNGQPPGYVFKADEGQAIDLQVKLAIDSSDPIRVVEIVKNGKVVEKTTVGPAGGEVSLGQLRFERSGWFLVRAFADVSHTFRFGSTGPYYVEIGEDAHHVSKRSVQFLLDWVAERRMAIRIGDQKKYRHVIKYHRAAQDFWTKRLEHANPD